MEPCKKDNKLINIDNNILIGLANLGNTCFMNSCLQLLFNCDILSELLNNKIENDKLGNNVLLNEYLELCRLLKQQNKKVVVSPKKFLASLQMESQKQNNLLFSGYSQNDIEEFFIFIVDNFHQGLKREVDIVIKGKPQHKKDLLAIDCYKMIKEIHSKEYSEIIDIFFGIHVSQISDLKDNLLSQRPEVYFTLNLPIPENNNKIIELDECIEEYLNPTLLNEENQYFYEKYNKKIDANKKMVIWSLPKILVISLKRFNNNLKKNQTLVNFQIDEPLNLCKFVKGYQPNSYIYELIGTGNHTGSLLGGHYYSYIKKNDGWYIANDTIIEKIENTNQIISKSSYLFFYRKKT